MKRKWDEEGSERNEEKKVDDDERLSMDLELMRLFPGCHLER